MMYRLFFILAPLLLFVKQNSLAQLGVGPMVGVQATQINYSSLYDGEQYGVRPKLGFKVGGIINYGFGKSFSLHSEILYSQKGKVLTSAADDNFKHKASYSFLEVPVLLRIDLRKGKFVAYGNIGPQVNYWLSGKGKIKATQPAGRTDTYILPYKVIFGEGNPDYDVIYVSDANRLQFGIDMGGGIMMPIKDEKLMIDFRITLGTTHMGKEKEYPISFSEFTENYQYTNHVLSVSIGYVFEFDLHEFRRGKTRTMKKH